MRYCRRVIGVVVVGCLSLAGVLLGGGDARGDETTAIFVMKTDGTAVRRLAQVQGYTEHGWPRWSHDGTRLAFDVSAGGGKRGKFYSVAVDGSGLRELGEHGMPDWSPDDKQLAYATRGTSAKPGTWVQNADGKGRNWLAAGLAPRWSPDGGRLAMLRDGGLVLFDLVEGGERKLTDDTIGEVLPGFDWSPDGLRLALVAERDGERRLWIVEADDAAKNKGVPWTGNLDGFLAWSPDAQRLAITLDAKIHVLKAGQRDSRPIPRQEAANRMPAWSPDGEWIAFVSTRATPTLEPATVARRALKLEEVSRAERAYEVYSVAFAPDGRRAILGGHGRERNVKLWDTVSGDTTTLDFYGIFLALSPDGRTLATGSLMPKVQLIDTQRGELIRDLHAGGVSTSMDFSPDGRRLVSGSINKVATVWEIATGKEICRFKAHQQWVNRVAFSADGKEALSVAHDKKLRVWDADTGQERLAIEHPDVIWGLAVSPDGRFIATGTGGPMVDNPLLLRVEAGNDNVLRLWDAASGNLVREMTGHTNVVYTIDISADARLAATGGWDGTIRLWDLQTGEQLDIVQGEGSIYSVSFSPDASQLLVGGGGNRFAHQRIQNFPNERVRLYKLVARQ